MMHRTLPTSMESSTATNSSFPAKVHSEKKGVNDFAVQAEMVAVETSIDVGNILWIFYYCLFCGSPRLREGVLVGRIGRRKILWEEDPTFTVSTERKYTLTAKPSP